MVDFERGLLPDMTTGFLFFLFLLFFILDKTTQNAVTAAFP